MEKAISITMLGLHKSVQHCFQIKCLGGTSLWNLKSLK